MQAPTADGIVAATVESTCAVLAVDVFGAECHARIGDLSDLEVDLIRDPALACSYSRIALVAGRPAPGLAHALIDAQGRHAFVFFPLWPVGRVMQLGPTVVPGRAPCYGCFERRQRQHAWNLHVHDASVAHQTALLPPTISLGPSLALLGAGLILTLLTRVGADTISAGEIVLIDWEQGERKNTHVVPVHGCERCGSPNDTSRLILFDELGESDG